ncbi:O-antigen ligase family protein [Caloramator sp. CAR-1]|uniref:O-antigen ligase family protein n=1 Tax=Caloramator sp. CAR-1 TaxID=3062777 RepID=UPI0026E3C296|nr:O-antigen ligase family protein [Caloramator sp. CAR-1]MDO6355732.1 O-antigen ligase family protein [Caloramator sp. CAR-1]
MNLAIITIFITLIIIYVYVLINPQFDLLLAFYLMHDLIAFTITKLNFNYSLQIHLILNIILFVRIIIKKKEVLINKNFLILLIFIIYSVINFLYFKFYDFSYGFDKIIIFIIKGVIPSIIIQQLDTYKLNLHKTALLSLIFIVSLILFGVENSLYPGRISFPNQNPIWNARILTVFFTIILFDLHMNIYYKLMLIILNFYSIYLTQSRGPVLAMILAFLLVKLMGKFNFKRTYKSIKIKKNLTYFILIVLLFIISTNINNFLNNSHIIASRFNILLNKSLLLSDANFLSRINLYREAINLIKNNLFFGIGIGNYSYYSYTSNYPHNLVLEILCELGLLGLTTWMFFIIRFFKQLKENTLLKVLFVQSLLFSFFSGDFGSNYEYMLFFITFNCFDIIRLRIKNI